MHELELKMHHSHSLKEDLSHWERTLQGGLQPSLQSRLQSSLPPSRRLVVGAVGAAGLALLSSGAAGALAQACEEIPSETAGPFPGNGTQGLGWRGGPNVLNMQAVVRRDVRASIGSASGVAAGVPLTLSLTLQNAKTCAPLANKAVHIWHCDALGRYSLYSPGAERENYLRGVQVSDAQGRLSFVTVFPGAYPGRWPHIHFEVFGSLEQALGGKRSGKTSQLALPKAACEAVYATAGYEGSAGSLKGQSVASDFVFRGGGELQTAKAEGDAARGFVASLQVNLAA